MWKIFCSKNGRTDLVKNQNFLLEFHIESMQKIKNLTNDMLSKCVDFGEKRHIEM